jgi:hypothetical protein
MPCGVKIMWMFGGRTESLSEPESTSVSKKDHFVGVDGIYFEVSKEGYRLNQKRI